MNNKNIVESAAVHQPGFRMKEDLVAFLLGITSLLVLMNTTMFNLALPSITLDFGLTTATASWVLTGYSIVFAISSITYSRLSDYLPIRTLLIIGLLSFGLASLLSMFSGSFAMLLISRFIQASGAAAIPTLGILLISRFIPTERRGKAMAIVMSCNALGLGLGPVMGGAITEYLGWQELSLITALSLLLVPFFFKILPREKRKAVTFDLAGAILLGVGITCILLFMTNKSWIAFIVGIVSLILFWFRIRSTDNPFIQPNLFRNKRYMILSLLGITFYMCSFVSLFMMPQVLAHSYGLAPGKAGLIIFPGALASMLISRKIGGIIDLHGNKPIFHYAPWFTVVGALLFALLSNWSMYAIMFAYVILSIGFTSLTTSATNELSRILPLSSIGAGMGLFQLLQFFSGAFSVAVTGVLLESFQSLEINKVYTGIFWGMVVVAAVVVLCAMLYTRMEAVRIKNEYNGASKGSVN